MTASRSRDSTLSREPGGDVGFAEHLLSRLQRARRRRRMLLATLGVAALAITVLAMRVLPASAAREINAGDLVAVLVLSGLAGLGWIRS